MAYTVTRAQATTRARALCARMKTSGWKIRVWDNMGWCYAICKPYIQVYPAMDDKSFFAMISPEPDGIGTPADWAVRKTFSDPNEAVLAAVSRLKEVRNQTNRVITTVLKNLGIDAI